MDLHLLTSRRDARSWLISIHGQLIEVKNNGSGTTNLNTTYISRFSGYTAPLKLILRPSFVALGLIQDAQQKDLSSSHRTKNNLRAWRKAIIFSIAVASFRTAGKKHLLKAIESQGREALQATSASSGFFKTFDISSFTESFVDESLQLSGSSPGTKDRAQRQAEKISQHGEFPGGQGLIRSQHDEPWSEFNPRLLSTGSDLPGSSVFLLDKSIQPFRRTRNLSPGARRHAKKMRRVGACEECKRKKLRV